MKIKNKSGRLIVLNYKHGKSWVNVHVPAGDTVNEPKLSETDVEHFVNEGSLEIMPDENTGTEAGTDTEAGTEAGTDTEAGTEAGTDNRITLASPVSAESLKKMSVKDLKQYCRENDLKPFSSLKEDELIEKIMGSLESK